MSWFDNQLRYRKQQDTENFREALQDIAGAVIGTRLASALNDTELSESAVDVILQYFRIKTKSEPMPSEIKDIDEQFEYRFRPHGIMRRRIALTGDWYKHAIGPMLGTLREDGSMVALLPNKLTGYSIYDFRTEKRTKLNKTTAKLLDTDAMCFYKPLPLRKLGIRDLLVYMFEQLTVSDAVLYLVGLATVTAIGLLSPYFTQTLFSDVLQSQSMQALVAIAMFMLSYALCQAMLTAFKALVQGRVNTKLSMAVQSAVFGRVMSLPASFFKKYSAGELSQRMSYTETLCSNMVNSIVNTGLTSVFSLVYVAQIFTFASAMVIPALCVMAVTILFSLYVTFRQMKITKQMMEYSAKENGVSFSMISGIQKIKLAGAERRMFSRWAHLHAKSVRLTYNPPMVLKLSTAINMFISLIGMVLMYETALSCHVSIADYYAFQTAYGMVSGAFMSLASIATTIANIKPSLEMAKPILEAEPEIAEGKEIVTSLSGRIEVSHLSFRYQADGPWILDDLSLTIKRGEYVALVGTTGCGKSTLMRLMLGFEQPEKGQIFYDGKPMSSLDLKSLRRNIGVVMQEGKLFTGDIFSNIVISAPQATMDEAWAAAESAAIADDIRDMPMGMHTIVGEGSGGISGGQRQRLMIARAIIAKPKILMFDEATSALDNITQKHVSESVDALKCTRIVIAHRLSTIRNCDRIIVLDKGHIIESGTYEELIEQNGFFADLVARQRVDVDA